MAESVIIDVKINTEQTAEQLGMYTKRLEDLRGVQALLNDEFKQGKLSNAEYGKAMADCKNKIEEAQRAIKSKTAILQAANIEEVKNTQSLDEQRQAVNTLQKAYANLSGPEKEMADMQGGLRDQIKAATEALKEQEHAIGEDQRNVGNYTESIKKAGVGAKELADAFKVSTLASTGLGKATDSLDKGMKLMATNPIMGIAALLVPLVVQLGKALMGNKEAMEQVHIIMNKLKEAFKQFEPVVQKLTKVLTAVLGKAIDIIMASLTGLLKLIDKVAAKFGKDLHLAEAFENASGASEELVESTEDATKAADEWMKKELEAANAVAKVREELARRKRSDMENELYDLEKKCQQELATERLTADERVEIETYYQEQKKAVEEKYAAEEAERQRTYAEQEAKTQADRMAALRKYGLEAEQTAEELELEGLKAVFDQKLISQEEFEEARKAIVEKYAAEREKVVEDGLQAEMDAADDAKDFMKKNMLGVAASVSGAFASISDALAQYGEQSEEAKAASKAFAVMSLVTDEAITMANMGKSISEAIAGATAAAAATGPAAPFMLAGYIASMVGAVVSGITSGVATISQAKQILNQSDDSPRGGHDAGRYAGGGVIPGNSFSGDKLIAHVDSGEVITPMDKAAGFYDMVMNGGGFFDYGLMAEAIAAMPAPIMDYQEFTGFQERTTRYQEFARL